MKTAALILALLLTACGGGNATEEEIAEADDAIDYPAPPSCKERPEICK
jgi:hypothetical protein